MNILVRVPKKEEAHFWDKVPEGNIVWWTLSTKPKDLSSGEYIYFQLGDKIVARAKVDSLQEGQMDCEDTGRSWKGCHVCWLAGALEKLDKPLKGHSLTRGFKYLTDPSSKG